MLRNVPKWLSDPQGPVTVKPSYAMTVAPWLWQWVKAGRMDRVRTASVALRQLHKDAYDGYRKLLGPTLFNDLIRQTGVVQIWETEADSRSDIVARELREMHAIETRSLSAADLQQMFPGISPAIKRGILLVRNGYTVNPGRLTASLAEILSREGGIIRQERVMKIIPRPNDGFNLITNVAYHHPQSVVVAAGAWSNALLKPLKVNLPLETERGISARSRRVLARVVDADHASRSRLRLHTDGGGHVAVGNHRVRRRPCSTVGTVERLH
jgi:D-amino-acid dehydrogenase